MSWLCQEGGGHPGREHGGAPGPGGGGAQWSGLDTAIWQKAFPTAAVIVAPATAGLR